MYNRPRIRIECGKRRKKEVFMAGSPRKAHTATKSRQRRAAYRIKKNEFNSMAHDRFAVEGARYRGRRNAGAGKRPFTGRCKLSGGAETRQPAQKDVRGVILCANARRRIGSATPRGEEGARHDGWWSRVTTSACKHAAGIFARENTIAGPSTLHSARGAGEIQYSRHGNSKRQQRDRRVWRFTTARDENGRDDTGEDDAISKDLPPPSWRRSGGKRVQRVLVGDFVVSLLGRSPRVEIRKRWKPLPRSTGSGDRAIGSDSDFAQHTGCELCTRRGGRHRCRTRLTPAERRSRHNEVFAPQRQRDAPPVLAAKKSAGYGLLASQQNTRRELRRGPPARTRVSPPIGEILGRDTLRVAARAWRSVRSVRAPNKMDGARDKLDALKKISEKRVREVRRTPTPRELAYPRRRRPLESSVGGNVEQDALHRYLNRDGAVWAVVWIFERQDRRGRRITTARTEMAWRERAQEFGEARGATRLEVAATPRSAGIDGSGAGAATGSSDRIPHVKLVSKMGVGHEWMNG
ncbi:hypothetical protein B0H11DRAFT_1935476 [Mycena galericulata]|nr:hypothetical protein B0H11DRAFT_1935476 [Mycena galericulata]